MKLILFLALMYFTVSCLGDNKFLVESTDHVDITAITIPDTIALGETVHISARAEEQNACWSNLNFVLTKNSEFSYSVGAFGFYSSTGYCPPKLVSEDTVLDLKPANTGKYLFYITHVPYKIVTDTLIVK